MTKGEIESFVASQIGNVKVPNLREKCVMVGGVPWRVLFNVERARSTRASVDPEAIAKRPCFLCPDNRLPWQKALNWSHYDILVNPYPILHGHLTIVDRRHVPQSITRRLNDIVDLATELEGHAVFYNGPRSGASAPDHAHFQAVPESCLSLHRSFPFERYYISGDSGTVVAGLKDAISRLEVVEGEIEPRLNMAIKSIGMDSYEAVLIPRREHRPACYGSVNVSPGALDMFGYIVTTSESDFDSVDTPLLEQIFREVAYERRIPMVSVGIMSAEKIDCHFHGPFKEDSDTFVPQREDCEFELTDVTIGVGFHWERKEVHRYRGALKLKKGYDGFMTAINILPVEEYLHSVISSEMSAHASIELLKAHAVLSRSWLLAQMRHNSSTLEGGCRGDVSETKVIKWYDHDDHLDFDVCADDHCQRYQGVSRIDSHAVYDAVQATLGEVLFDVDGNLCDARFSKCCGGAFEEFENCWEPVHHSYLVAALDTVGGEPMPDLTDEEEARRWIMSRPESFCAAPSDEILSHVLNSYDRETPDFYRWTVEYGSDELSDLVSRRSGIDFGSILELIPEKRGTSGRIYELKIVGTKRTVTVGKELEIRKWLSPSHLYSSAFVVDRRADGRWIFHGAGWGHGVGLCQIGAAVMGAKGFSYKEILHHYFRNAEIRRAY
ncbi:MAG: DUF4922 domain-containing protein [Muribaculum sp.]|nr:DUF4922 domain-containing protein [Muribaculum sp.]